MNIDLRQGDCLEVMKGIPDGSVDAIITDPPYGSTQNKWDSVINLELMWAEIWRVLKPNGACLLFSMNPFTAKLISSQIKYYKYEWIWVKNLKTGNLNARRMPMGGHETIQVFYKKPPTYNPQKRKRTTEVKSGNKKNSKTSNYGKQRDEYADRQDNWINPDTIINGIKCVHNSSGKVHPTQKPTELFEYLIKTYTDEGDIVLDNTAGSGSLGEACIEENRDFILIEKEPNYYEVIKDRVGKIFKNYGLDLQPLLDERM